jgi:hypothetical protein
MTAAQNLMADPAGFMADNIVIVEMEGNNAPRTTNGPVTLRLYARPTARITGRKRSWKSPRVGVYYLSPDPVPAFFMDAIIDPNIITAYFCPYKQGETHGTMISNGADLMFTTQMDGCTLGIGSRTPGGDRLIFHANSGGTSNVAMNNQDQSLRAEFRTNNTLIQQMWSPLDYRTSRRGTAYKATTFGVRNPGTGDWNFYCQRYTVESMTPRIKLGLKEVKDVL